MKPLVTYKVSVLPTLHEVQIEMLLEPPLAGALVTLQIPAWVPGSYRFQPFGRDLFNIQAFDQSSGRQLSVIRQGWQGFRIEGGTGAILITYRVWAYDRALSQACGLVEDACAVLQGTQFLFVPGWSGPCRVFYDLPHGWRLHLTGGIHDIRDPRICCYENYESLLDSPAVAGEFDCFERSINGTRFHFVFIDRALGFRSEVDSFVDRLTRVAAECGRIFEGFPFRSYSFVLTTRPDLRWGLEHKTSSLCGIGPDVFIDPPQTARAMRVCAHELFHAWNVRRLRPSPLAGPLDLTNGTFTEGLWLAEGFTRYYEFLVCTRTRDYTPEQFFSSIVNNWNHLTRAPAYRRVSATASSQTTFLNHQRYQGSANTSIDYYQKGMLIAFDLDVRLRLRGDSLDAVMNHLFRSMTCTGCGYELNDVVRLVCERSNGAARMLEREVALPGTLTTLRQLVRLGFHPTMAHSGSLGVVVDRHRAEVTDVMDTSPAGRNGLAPGDVIKFIDGFAFSPKALKWVARRPGPISLQVLRGHRERSFHLVPEPRVRIEGLEWSGTPHQAAQIGSWLNARKFSPGVGEHLDTSFYENFHGVENFY